MGLTTIETLHSQIPFEQIGNLISSPKVFPKQSFEQIAETEISYCNISFSDFSNIFKFEIVDLIGNEFSEQITFKLEYAGKILIHLKLNGYWELNKESEFQLDDVDWVFEEKEGDPTSAFFLETFKVILTLSNKVKVEIPTINYWFEVAVPLPLSNISEILQNRRLAYRLMVIEKAFQISLPFPRRYITGEEVANITYCYHSIIDRKFEWFCPPAIIPWYATQNYLSLLPEKNVPFPMQYGPEPFVKEIFGSWINLGLQIGKINMYVLDNYDEVREKLSQLDGSEVLVRARSVNGTMQIESRTTPHLPKDAFNKTIQKLVDLEEKLDSVYFDKYSNSFSNAFENLTKKQILAVTERPNLEEEAFNF